MKFSDLDMDIPTSKAEIIRNNLVKARVLTSENQYQKHPAGIYLYKEIPSFEGYSILDYKSAEDKGYQKIDILNNHFLDDIESDRFFNFLEMIDNENIDWSRLYDYEEPYQLSKYPKILKEFKVKSVMDVAIVLALIRPGALSNFDKMKKYIHSNIILKKKSPRDYDILKETYGIPVFDEQFKMLGVKDNNYRYKKPHAIGYAYVLLLDFLNKTI